MTDLSLTRLWTMRAAFLALALLILLFHLLPLDTTPRKWAGPDLLLAFACAWVVRRPDYVPAVALALAFLLADLLLQRPPGLWALVALLGTENLRSRGRGLRDASFVLEWLTVAGVIIAITLLNRLILALTFSPLPGLALSLFELGMTLLVYPLIAATTHFAMGVRKAAPGDLDTAGYRI